MGICSFFNYWLNFGLYVRSSTFGGLMMDTRNYLIEQYLDFRNNYLTPELFAEHRGMTEEQGQILIDLGRNLFNSKNIHE